jgi:RHS repeat-associated protein
VGGSFARTLLPDAITSATYDQGNRQLAFGASTMTFDDNGNLLTQTDPSGTLAYTWDARNRLTGLSGGSASASFGYDAFGRRAQKTIDSVTTAFRYDGLDIVKETDGVGDVSYLRTLGIDEVLTRTDSAETGQYLADALGSTMALTDSTGGATTTYTHEPFGRTAVEGTGINAFQYTGRENDGTGLYYYRARYYDPGRGRFISEDPIGFAGGDIDLYPYVIGNPSRWTDPLGLKLCATNLPGLGDTYVDDSVAPLVEDFIRRNSESGVDVRFTEAFRTSAYQQSLADNPNATTPAPPGNSLHEAGFAVDISWRPLRSNVRRTVVRNARDAGLKWGGDFRRPDPVHYYREVPGGPRNRSQYIQEAQEAYKKGNVPQCP